jgi:hypothetical protein
VADPIPQTTTKHTPGPWQVGRGIDDAHMCEVMTAAYAERPNLSPSHKLVCRTWAPDGQPLASFIGFSRRECLANARLIAAAPDLLAALEGVLRVADRATDEFDAARAAIAKAKGEDHQ